MKICLIKTIFTLILVSFFCFICLAQQYVLILFGYGNYVDAVNSKFSVTFFNVGQGDATLIKYSDTSILIDAGPSDSSQYLCEQLREINQENEIDYFILTHADADHVGGGKEVFKKFDIKNFIRPKMLSKSEEKEHGNPNDYGVHKTEVYDEVIKASYVEKSNVTYVESGTLLSNNEFQLEILYPFSDGDLNKDNSNSYSAVMRVKFLDASFLFMADADGSIENKLIEKYGQELNCDILKVAHHGSKNGTTKELLDFATPNYSIISVGETGIDEYGHASEEFKEKIHACGSKILQTNESGHIIFSENNIFAPITLYNVPQVPIAILSAVFLLLILFIWGIKQKTDDKNIQKND